MASTYGVITGPMPPSPSLSAPRDTLGHVVSVGGSHAGVRLAVPAACDAAEGQRITVGKFLAMETPASSVVGVITDVDGIAASEMARRAAR